jgi:lysine 2,3-aminomutase
MASYNKISELFDANPSILRILVNSDTLSQARKDLMNYLNLCFEEVNNISSPLHPLEKKNTRHCIEVFKNLIAPINEHKTNHSCLHTLWKLATEHWRQKEWPDVSDAFLEDMKHIFKGVIGLSGIYSKSGICKREVPAFVHLEGREAAIVRSNLLNEKTQQYKYFIEKNGYRSGLDPEIIKRRVENKQKILDLLRASEEDWTDYSWHLKNVFKTAGKIGQIIDLGDEEEACIDRAVENNIPFGITPFYLSLMDGDQSHSNAAWTLRAHVIPNRPFLDEVLEVLKNDKCLLDFMNERDTSPVDLVTRRYPLIAIFKPFMTCSQICVYCQRNWEVLDLEDHLAVHSNNRIERALSWFKSNPEVEEVLITGGDPLVMTDEKIDHLLHMFSEMSHIKRIRIATRLLVTIPLRFTNTLMDILTKYHTPPQRTLTIVTHVQNAYEISEEMAQAVNRIKQTGIDVLNQQVFTIQNCRKFETCFLRENLKRIGITPYYLFNLKGKKETRFFKVPIARLLQENKEEARLMPGIMRTDKPVFNVPKLGKNHLISWQDHDLIMIFDDGSRVYEFYPWEKYMAPVDTFLFSDEPIYDFLKKLEQLGENPDYYKTIWYYF